MIKKTFGGGPTIQFFLLGDENILRQDELIKQTNLIYSKDYSLYGYPDINPEYYELALEIKDTSNGEEVLKIPYKLLLSKHMTWRSLLYYVATRLMVDVSLLTLHVSCDDENQDREITTENGYITLSQIKLNSKCLKVRYSGTIGKDEFLT